MQHAREQWQVHLRAAADVNDRGLRELPIEANYVGKYVQTSRNEIVEVRLTETDRQECVVLTKGIE